MFPDLQCRKVHRREVHDLHATVLNLLGVDHMRLEYRPQGRPERPTINEGKFLEQITRRA